MSDQILRAVGLENQEEQANSKRTLSINQSDLEITVADLSHLDAIVRIHLATFKGFFLELMGSRFLHELYRGFIVESSGLCLVAIYKNSEAVGFVAGTTEPERFFRRLLRHRWHAFLLAGASSLLQHPSRIIERYLFALRYRGERPLSISRAALLSSIGVLPDAKGKGIGTVLISSFCDEVTKVGISTLYLTTDRDNNDAVNAFYLVNGFQLHSSFLKNRSRWMNLYIRSLTEMSSLDAVHHIPPTE